MVAEAILNTIKDNRIKEEIALKTISRKANFFGETTYVNKLIIYNDSI